MIDGQVFLGLSLSRQSKQGHLSSKTHQLSFDLNSLLDREYIYVASTSDDGWLAGGGEPMDSYKLASPDSAHIELLRIGTFKREWGGIPQKEILQIMDDMLIPQITVLPTSLQQNEKTQDLELHFEMTSTPNKKKELPTNWQLQFLQKQLANKLEHYPPSTNESSFYCTLARNVQFHSSKHRTLYFTKCQRVLQNWKQNGPQPLHTMQGAHSGLPKSGFYLFTDRKTITHFFQPNFLFLESDSKQERLQKKELILQVLQQPLPKKTKQSKLRAATPTKSRASTPSKGRRGSRTPTPTKVRQGILDHTKNLLQRARTPTPSKTRLLENTTSRTVTPPRRRDVVDDMTVKRSNRSAPDDSKPSRNRTPLRALFARIHSEETKPIKRKITKAESKPTTKPTAKQTTKPTAKPISKPNETKRDAKKPTKTRRPKRNNSRNNDNDEEMSWV